MPTPTTQSAQLLTLAQRFGVDIPNEVTAVVRNAPKGSELNQWLDDTSKATASLSADDHELWTRISRHNDLDEESIFAAASLVDDEGFHRAIKSLDASSRQITARTRTLASQKTLLGRSRSGHDVGIRASNSGEHDKAAAKCQHVRLSNDAKSTHLADTIRSNLAALDKEAKMHPAAVGERMKADDRVFEGLEQRAHTDSVLDANQEILTRAHKLARALQSNRVSSLKDRLDRAYLTSLKNVNVNEQLEADTVAGIPDLQQDVQSLYTEIDDMVTMTIGHEYMNQLQTTMARVSVEQQNRTNEILEEARLRIVQMTDQIDSLASQIQRVQAHRRALSEASRHLDKSLASTAGTAAPSAGSNDAAPRTVDPAGLNVNVSTASSAKASLQALAVVKETLENASSQRAQAVQRLQVLEGATNTKSLDDLDRRIATTSKHFDEVVNQTG